MKGRKQEMEKKKAIWMLNGAAIPADPNIILPAMFETIPDLPFWSLEALKELYIGLLEIGQQMAKEERKCKKGAEAAKMTRFINAIPNRVKFLPRDRKRMLQMMYNCILTSDGYPNLNGFRMTNRFGDNINRNPELQSITTRRI